MRTGTDTRSTIAIDHTKVRALTRNTTCTVVKPSSTADSAGPAKKASESTVLAVPLAAVSSSGRSARLGRSARCATRNGVPSSDDAVARTNTGAAGVSRNRQVAAPVTSSARARSASSISRLRDILSARVELNGAVIAISDRRIAIQMPTPVAPPTPYAQTATAVA